MYGVFIYLQNLPVESRMFKLVYQGLEGQWSPMDRPSQNASRLLLHGSKDLIFVAIYFQCLFFTSHNS